MHSRNRPPQRAPRYRLCSYVLKQKCRNRQNKAQLKEKQWLPFWNPQQEKEKGYYTAFGRFESPKSKLHQELAKHIGDGSRGDCFQALLTCTKKLVSVSDSKQYVLDTKPRLLLDRDVSLPMKIAVNAVRQVWLASQLGRASIVRQAILLERAYGKTQGMQIIAWPRSLGTLMY